MKKKDNDSQTVIDWFREALAHSGLTQAEIARRIWNNDRSVPNKIFLGKRKVQAHELTAIQAETGFRAYDDRPAAEPPKKFLRTSSVKFYVRDWRLLMGVSVANAAKAAGLVAEEYEAHESYPVNFTLGQISALADEFGIRGDQFWWPAPKVPETERTSPAARRTKVAVKPRA